MNLPPEFIEYLQNEVKALDGELKSILELPNVNRLRNRLKKEKRDTEDMLYLYNRIEQTNKAIRAVKDRIRACQAMAKKLTGKGILRVKRKYNSSRDTGYDL